MIEQIIKNALQEDIGEGDHSSLCCIPENAQGRAQLLVKEDGILAGIELAQEITRIYDPQLKFKILYQDGAAVKNNDVAFELYGPIRSILGTERLILNFMQRMSGIATKTNSLTQKISHTSCKLLDTRKTTPGIRFLEKWAVRIGGGQNHRFGLYDMIMLKDNHIDFAGGIENAILKANSYIEEHKTDLKIEIEVRNLDELTEVLRVGKVDRIMLDNFTPKEIVEAIKIIPLTYETEASGGINEDNIVAYAEAGVKFISVGALTHSVKSLDLSLKALDF